MDVINTLLKPEIIHDLENTDNGMTQELRPKNYYFKMNNLTGNSKHEKLSPTTGKTCEYEC